MLEREIPARAPRGDHPVEDEAAARVQRALVERVDSRSRDWRKQDSGQLLRLYCVLVRIVVSFRAHPPTGSGTCPGVVINFAAGHLGWCTFDRPVAVASGSIFHALPGTGFLAILFRWNGQVCQSSTTTGSSQNRRVVALWSRACRQVRCGRQHDLINRESILSRLDSDRMRPGIPEIDMGSNGGRRSPAVVLPSPP